MFKPLAKKKASSTIEYMTLLTILMLALIIFSKYISMGFTGQWQKIGDTFGQGIRFDGDDTIECVFDDIYTGNWYNILCFEQFCDCRSTFATTLTCETCINTRCRTPYCDP